MSGQSAVQVEVVRLMRGESRAQESASEPDGTEPNRA